MSGGCPIDFRKGVGTQLINKSYSNTNQSSGGANSGVATIQSDYLRTWGGDVWSDNNATPGAVGCSSDLDCVQYPGLNFCNATSGVCQPRPSDGLPNRPFRFDGYANTQPEAGTSNMQSNQPQKLMYFDPFRMGDDRASGVSGSESVALDSTAQQLNGYTTSYRQDSLDHYRVNATNYIADHWVFLLAIFGVILLGGFVYYYYKKSSA